jgi:hypothetical protein
MPDLLLELFSEEIPARARRGHARGRCEAVGARGARSGARRGGPLAGFCRSNNGQASTDGSAARALEEFRGARRAAARLTARFTDARMLDLSALCGAFC